MVLEMMERGLVNKMEDKITKGGIITAIILALAALGIPLTDLTTGDAINELDNYYICDVLGADSLHEYTRLSGTKYSAYPYMDSRTGAKLCKDSDGIKGIWYILEEYATEQGLDPYQLLVQEYEPEPVVEPTPEPEPKSDFTYLLLSQPQSGKQYLCSPNGCKGIA